MTLVAAACLCMAVVTWPGRGTPVIRAREVRPRMRLHGVLGRRRRHTELDAVTAMLEGIAPALAAGVTPATAVAASASLAGARVSGPGLRRDLAQLAREARAGGELAPLWAQLHARHRIAALDDVARAWALSEQLGCPIGDALRAATAMLREQVDLQRRIDAATAGPRATMQLLTALPVIGLVIASLIGVPPWQLYAGRFGVAVLLLGALFVVAGRQLTRRMIRRASRPAALS